MSDANELPARSDLPILIDPAELPVRTFVMLYQANQRIGRKMEALLDAHGLSAAQFDVLATLQFGQGITQQELAGRLLVTKGNVCGLLDRMSAAGLVERRADPEDRRANRLYLTDAGKALLRQAMPAHHELVRHLLGGLRPAELETLHGLLQRVNHQAKI